MKQVLSVLISVLLGLAVCLAAGNGARGEERVLTEFEYSYGGYAISQSWRIERREEGYMLQENGGEPVLIDSSWVEEIEKVIREYNLISWDGFDDYDPNILDGESFWLDLAFSDGVTVHAAGDNAFPDHYSEATDRIWEILQQEKRTRIAGNYRYEGGGFGGDFDITLNADGTYTFYEGFLSSYLGGGEWIEYRNAIDMTELNGLDLHFTFGYEGDTIVYLALGSDAFPYVQVPDMGRFVRTDGEREADSGEQERR